MGIGGAGFAYLAKAGYDKKLSDLNALVGPYEKDPTGKIYLQTNYDSYKTSFDEVKTLKTAAETKIMIGLGVAGVAALVETYLFIKKPKEKKISLRPISDGVQLTIKF